MRRTARSRPSGRSPGLAGPAGRPSAADEQRAVREDCARTGSASLMSRSTMFDTNPPKASVASARYRPRSRRAGRATSPPTSAVARTPSGTPHQVSRDARPAPTIPTWKATMVPIAPNASDGEVQLARVAGQQRQRQRDDREGHAERERGDRPGRHEQAEQVTRRRGRRPRPRPCGPSAPVPLPGADRGAAQPVLRQDEQDDEQQDHRQRDAEVTDPGPAPTGGRRPRSWLDRPSTMPPTNVRGMLRRRPNMAAANASITSRVSGVGAPGPAADRGDQDAGEDREHGAEGPRQQWPTRSGSCAVELEQVGVVDDARMATPTRRAVEQQPQAGGDRRRRATRQMISWYLMMMPPRSTSAGAEELLEDVGLVRVPDPLRQGDRTRAAPPPSR